MDPGRIAELLEPFLGAAGERRLSSIEVDQISTYIDILTHWNARINLTAIRNSEDIVTRHFGESLFAARHLFTVADGEINGSPIRLADIGSGAGFPGLPIKLWFPRLEVTLIESNHKKAAFLREVTRALTLTNVDIRNVRAETLSAATFEMVTLRAVERFADTLHIAARLMAPRARLVLLIAKSQLGVANSALPDLSWDPPVPIPWSKSRVVVLCNKVG
jgi:16S rRNA (guanine527-N7)-methyltransferase